MKTTRREFIGQNAVFATGMAAAGLASCRSVSPSRSVGQIQTVLGPIPSETLGVTLVHEHVLVDFIGAAQIRRDRYDPEEVFQVALPHLQRVRELGCRTLVECTPAFLGRDPALLKRLATASQLHLLTNTGYYGAGKDKYLPAHALVESAEQLAGRWIREFREGIEGTGVRPGFIKIGVDAGPLSDLHRKLVQAAAQTHSATGLTIAAHTGDGRAALDELAVLEGLGVAGEAFIWVHAQSERESALHARAAERGAWVEFDGISAESIDRNVTWVTAMRDRGFLHRVLLSHDAGWYHVGEPGGGKFRSFDTLFSQFIPALRKAGFSEAEIHQLTAVNPARALKIRVRRR